MLSKFQSRILFPTLLVALLSFKAQTAGAQSTLVTIPSTDVVSNRNVYLEFDYISHYASHHNGGVQTYKPRAVAGVGNNVEVGINGVYTDGLCPKHAIEIHPGIQ